MLPSELVAQEDVQLVQVVAQDDPLLLVDYQEIQLEQQDVQWNPLTKDCQEGVKDL